VTGRLFVISGPSGVGKGTLIRLVREQVPALELAVSATTRPRRPGEVDGRDYHFLDEAEFEYRVERGEFIEQVTFAGHRYGTLRSEVEGRLADGRSVVLEIDVPGAREIKCQMPDAVLVFIAPPSLADLKARLAGRGANTVDEIDSRLRIAQRELASAEEFDHVITNDDRARAARELEEVVRAALPDQGADR
jgi:guanylate kinase